jgi:hypothetical protein
MGSCQELGFSMRATWNALKVAVEGLMNGDLAQC